MSRATAPLAALCFLLGTAACTSDAGLRAARRTLTPSEQKTTEPGPDETVTRTSKPSPRPSGESSSSREGAVAAPPPNAALPRGPRGAADALVRTHRALNEHASRWLADGARPGTRDERGLELWALFQQRLYRALAVSPARASEVETLLPRNLRATFAANLNAQRDLSSLVTPVKPPIELDTYDPAPARALRGWHERAGERVGVPWQVLAAVNLVESRFGRILGPSSAGALGPMQFLPSTWSQYGNGGDVMDPRDAIFGAARYLKASGAPANMRAALYAYNRSDAYVDAVLAYAGEMRRNPDAFYAYYFWQVFVKTTRGDVQLTGPGAAPRPGSG